MDHWEEWSEIAERLYRNDLDYVRLLPKYIAKSSNMEIGQAATEAFGEMADGLSREEKIKALAGRITQGWVFRDK